MKFVFTISILLLFIIEINQSNIYALLCGALTYSYSYIFPDLGNWVGVLVQIFICVCFSFRAHTFLRNLYLCRFLFLFLFMFWFFYIFVIFTSPNIFPDIDERVIIIMSRLNTNWSCVACDMMWYMLRTAKAVAAKISGQGSSSFEFYFGGQTFVWVLLWLDDFVINITCLVIYLSCQICLDIIFVFILIVFKLMTKKFIFVIVHNA